MPRNAVVCSGADRDVEAGSLRAAVLKRWVTSFPTLSAPALARRREVAVRFCELVRDDLHNPDISDEAILGELCACGI